MSALVDLAFLHARGQDVAHQVSEHERRCVAATRAEVVRCDGVVFLLGGRAGRLGEVVVATALLEGFLLALVALDKECVPVRIVVDGIAAGLFDVRLYRSRFWPEIELMGVPLGGVEGPDTDLACLVDGLHGRRPVIVDLHGGHDGMPALSFSRAGGRRIATLARLHRVGIRSYAARGRARRYAAFVEELLDLPAGTIDCLRAQPTIRLSQRERAAYSRVARAHGLRPDAPLIVGFFQSAVAAKCYGHWHEVLVALHADFSDRFPGGMIEFLIVCGPDDLNPEGIRFDDLRDEHAGFATSDDAIRLRVVRTRRLRELAVLLTGAVLVLSNDTGPGHIAGALRVPIVVPYLPGEVYSMRVWSSTLWHHGVTLDPSPFTRQQIENAVFWNRTNIINAIPPHDLIARALTALPAGFRTG